MLCQHCKKRNATVHLTDLVKGEKKERHLCEECASSEGIAVKQHVSINEVLNTFLSSQSSVQALANVSCPDCGMTFMEFRSKGLLGCPKDYDIFGEALENLIERAQEGYSHHTGKQPGQEIILDPVQSERLNLQRQLRDAVEREDYEKAADLRDRLNDLRD